MRFADFAVEKINYTSSSSKDACSFAVVNDERLAWTFFGKVLADVKRVAVVNFLFHSQKSVSSVCPCWN